MIWNRHQHTWEITGARYNPSPAVPRSAQNMDPGLLMETIHGFTVVTHRCTECGRLDFSRTPGQPDLGGVS